jgi:hypothetical protein
VKHQTKKKSFFRLFSPDSSATIILKSEFFVHIQTCTGKISAVLIHYVQTNFLVEAIQLLTKV